MTSNDNKPFIVKVKWLDDSVEEFEAIRIAILNRTTLYIRRLEGDKYIALNTIKWYSYQTDSNDTITISMTTT